MGYKYVSRAKRTKGGFEFKIGPDSYFLSKETLYVTQKCSEAVANENNNLIQGAFSQWKYRRQLNETENTEKEQEEKIEKEMGMERQ